MTGVVGNLPGFRTWIALSIAAAILMAVASAAGIYMPDVYGNETASWAAQGVGQDIANLFVVLPALLMCAYLAGRGSVRALLVWLGLLLYIVYSYLLYAFYVHFNVLFLVYVSVLSLSFWALVGAATCVNVEAISVFFDQTRRYTAAALYLMASGILFTALWLSDVVSALASGTTPRDLAEVGLPVNPVHVLDLAFVLPALVATGILLWKRRLLGLVFAVPLITFTVTMGLAIIAMSAVMAARGLGAAPGVIGGFTAVISLALALLHTFLRRIKQTAVLVDSTRLD